MPFAKAIYAAIFLTTFWFGLTPFNFLSSNDIAAVDSQSAWAFNAGGATAVVSNGARLEREDSQQGLAFTEDTVVLDAATGMSVLIEGMSFKQPSGLGVIIQLHDGQEQPPLIIAQWLDHLAIRSRRLAKNEGKPYAEIGLRQCFAANHAHALLISSDADGTRLYLDGVLAETKKWFTLVDPSGAFTGRLTIGNDPNGVEPWHGQLKQVRLYNRAVAPEDIDNPDTPPVIAYRFDQPRIEQVPNAAGPGFTLRAPERFRPLERVWLAGFGSDSLLDPKLRGDILINIVGFMPFGIALALIAMSRGFRFVNAFALSLFLSFDASLLIESCQAFLPTRDSSLLDLTCNTLGGTLAAGILLVVVRSILGPWRFS